MTFQAARAARYGSASIPVSPGPFLLVWPLIIGAVQMLTGEASRLPFVVAAGIVLTPMAAGWVSRTRSMESIDKGIAWGWLFLIAVTIATFRAPELAMTATTKFGAGLGTLLLYPIMLLAFSTPDEDIRRRRLNLLLLAIPLFVAVNLAIFAAHPGGQATLALNRANINATLGAFGLAQARLQYLPGLTGSATIGSIAAISIVSLVHLAATSRPLRPLAIALIIPSAIAIVLADTRSMIAAAAICSLLYLSLSARRLAALARLMVIFTAASSFILTGFFALISATGLGEALGRGTEQGARLGAGTGRTLIWDGVFRELSHPRPEHFLGYGAYGDLKSGVSASYAWLFYGKDGVPSYHNTFLQYALDAGYFTAILYFALMWIAVSRLRFVSDVRSARGCVAILLLVLVGGCTEVIGTPLQFEAFLFILGVLAFAFTAPIRPAADGRDQ